MKKNELINLDDILKEKNENPEFSKLFEKKYAANLKKIAKKNVNINNLTNYNSHPRRPKVASNSELVQFGNKTFRHSVQLKYLLNSKSKTGRYDRSVRISPTSFEAIS